MVFAPPITMFVAAPNAVTVNAVVLNNAIVELPAMMEVVKVGEVAKVSAPLPVSSVTAAARFADDGVARKVATPVPRPETPVLIGNPVQLVSVPLIGVPSAGVTSVGDVANTSAPVPVDVVATAASRFALVGVTSHAFTFAPSVVHTGGSPRPPPNRACVVSPLSISDDSLYLVSADMD